MKKNIKNYKLIQIFLAIISIFSISLFLLIFNLSDTMKEDLNNFNKNTNNTYRLSDTYFNEDEYNFLNTSQASKKLTLFANYLEKNKNFNYIIDGRQYISSENLSSDLSIGFFEDIPEYDDVFEGIQVSQNFFELFGIKISEGNYFTTKDYIYKQNTPLPVIIGSSFYKDISLNDKIDFYWNGKKFEGFISAFLKPGSHYNDGMDIQILDRTIITPSINLDSLDNSEDFYDLLVFDKINGLVKTSDSSKLIQNNINLYASEIGLKNFQLSNTNSIQLNLWGLEGDSLVKIMTKISSIILVISIFCVSINLIIQLTFVSKDISIYLVNGYKFFRILNYFSIRIFILNLISIVIGSLISYVLLGYQNNQLNILILCLTSIIEISIVSIKLKKINISKEIRS